MFIHVNSLLTYTSSWWTLRTLSPTITIQSSRYWAQLVNFLPCCPTSNDSFWALFHIAVLRMSTEIQCKVSGCVGHSTSYQGHTCTAWFKHYWNPPALTSNTRYNSTWDTMTMPSHLCCQLADFNEKQTQHTQSLKSISNIGTFKASHKTKHQLLGIKPW